MFVIRPEPATRRPEPRVLFGPGGWHTAAPPASPDALQSTSVGAPPPVPPSAASSPAAGASLRGPVSAEPPSSPSVPLPLSPAPAPPASESLPGGATAHAAAKKPTQNARARDFFMSGS